MGKEDSYATPQNQLIVGNLVRLPILALAERIGTEPVRARRAWQKPDLQEQPKQSSDDREESEDAERVPRLSAAFGQRLRHGGDRNTDDQAKQRSGEPPAGAVTVMEALGHERVDDPEMRETDDTEQHAERAGRLELGGFGVYEAHPLGAGHGFNDRARHADNNRHDRLCDPPIEPLDAAFETEQ